MGLAALHSSLVFRSMHIWVYFGWAQLGHTVPFELHPVVYERRTGQQLHQFGGSTSIYKDHESFISGSKVFDITVLENYGRTGLGFKELRYYGIRGK
jgi:hypothetical protein